MLKSSLIDQTKIMNISTTYVHVPDKVQMLFTNFHVFVEKTKQAHSVSKTNS